MAEEPTTPQAEPDGGQQDPSKDEGKTFTQAELDKIVADRLGRERSKYAGFEDLKAKAARLDELEQQNQSELEKAQTKVQKAEQRAVDAEARLLRFEVAQEKEVPAKLVPLLTASDRDGLESQADLILENAKTEPTPDFDGGPRDPAPEPKTPEQSHDSFVGALLTGQQPNE